MWQKQRRVVGYLGAYVALLAIALIPVWLVTIPPLVDYPNHLARMHILIYGPDSRALQQFYEVRWTALPNLAMDLMVPPLTQLMPLESAGRVFVSLTLAALSSGVLALHYALHRRVSPWPLVVFLLLYNTIFLYGILNFLFGLGLALWALAGWIYLRDRSCLLRAFVASFLSVLLFFAHLSALGVYALCVVGYEFARARAHYSAGDPTALRAWTITLGQFLVPMGVLILASPTGGTSASPAFQYDDIGFVAARKLGGLLLLIGNYEQVLDAAAATFVLFLVVFALFIRRLSVSSEMRYAIAALVLAFLVMPFQLYGSNFADSRLTVALALVLIACSDARLPNGRVALGLALCLLSVHVVRMGAIIDRWKKSDEIHSEYLQAIDKLPAGSKLLAAWAGKSVRDIFDSPGPHLSALAVIKKSVFLPTMYAMSRGQPISFTPRYLALAESWSKREYWGGESPPWDKLTEQYDYVFAVREKLFDVPPPPALQLVHEGTNFRLYKTSWTASPLTKESAEVLKIR